ncbi:MAG: hypothetical protein FJ091_19195 [Deltaproteobacteria bacterium]|nr:hypothetical protein [Deltaproteobacteria bacterium]
MGTGLQVATPIALAVALAEVFSAFQEMSAAGTANARELADAIGAALPQVLFAGLFGSLGAVISLLTVLFTNYRSRWFFWCSLGLAVFNLSGVPWATLLALAQLAVFVVKRREFFVRSD